MRTSMKRFLTALLTISLLLSCLPTLPVYAQAEEVAAESVESLSETVPAATEAPFSWDAKPATGSYQDFIRSEGRYKALVKANPAEAEALFEKAEKDAAKRMEFYQNVGKLM